MGLFDFLKGKNKVGQSDTVKKTDAETNVEEIKYETKLTAREITNDAEVVQRIVEKIVDEDPFKNFYNGKTEDDFGVSSYRTYKYDTITTINIDLTEKDKNSLSIYIEGIFLGSIPQQKSDEINQYRETYLLTSYVYVTGGPFKEYSQTEETVKSGSAPYGLDIFIQFT